MTLRVFLGFDPRQPVALQVLAHSIYTRASGPVSITPLVLKQLPNKRRGLTEFSMSRYQVPHLCDYEGQAIFMDADMLCLTDIYELVDICRQNASVCVVKNKLRYEWPSLMYFHNALCTRLTIDLIEHGTPQDLAWAEAVGEIPAAYNHLVGYDAPRKDAKICHFTQGIACFDETKDCEYSAEWNAELQACNSTVAWSDIMGGSVHAEAVLKRRAAA